MQTPEDIRRAIGRALVLARHAETVHASRQAGINHQITARLESGRNQSINLASVYLLAQHYGVALDRLLQLAPPPRTRADLGIWSQFTPPLPDLDAALRSRLRERRLELAYGTKWLAKQVGLAHNSWVVRLESGELAHCDLVRIERCAQALGTSVCGLLPPGSWRSTPPPLPS